MEAHCVGEVMVYQEIDNVTPTTVTFKDVCDIINETNQEVYSVSAGGTPIVGVQNRVWATGNGANTEASFRALVAADIPTGISADKLINGSTNKVFTATEQTKLSGIAANAIASEPLQVANYICGFPNVAFNINVKTAASTLTLIDAIQYLVPIYLDKDTTLTGISLVKTNQASYTGDQTNAVALYTESGGTLTRVAQGTGLEVFLESAATGLIQVPFSGLYVATAGVYWASVLANWSAVVTSPILLSGTCSSSVAASNRSLSRTIAAQTAPQSSFALSTTSAATNVPVLGLY